MSAYSYRRALPRRSRLHPQFNVSALAANLASIGIAYRHVPELGGRNPLPMPELRKRIAAMLPMEPGTCLMCSEGDYRECHRHQLLARLFLEPGVAVDQITPG